MSLSKAAEELLERIREGDVVSPAGKDHDIFLHTRRESYLLRQNVPCHDVCTSVAKELLDAGLVQIEEWPKGRIHLRATVEAERQSAREARIRDEAGAMYALFPWLVDMFAAYIEDVSGREIDASHPDYERLTKAREIVRRIEGQ